MSLKQDANGIPLFTPPVHTTYFTNEVVAGPSGGGPGGTNKPMLTLLNPSGSARIVKLLKVVYQAVSTSGTSVIVDWELQRITSHTAGTTITPSKRNLASAASVAEVRKEPSEVGSATRVQTFVMQSNTQQAPQTHQWNFGDLIGEEPFVLAAGEGIVVHQVTSNGGNFAITLVWTEE